MLLFWRIWNTEAVINSTAITTSTFKLKCSVLFRFCFFTVQLMMACNLKKRLRKREDGDGEDEVDIKRSNTETSRYRTEKAFAEVF